MTPDKVVDLLVEMAEEGRRLAESVQKAATQNQDEAARFVTDSQALVYVAQAWRRQSLCGHRQALLSKNQGQEVRPVACGITCSGRSKSTRNWSP